MDEIGFWQDFFDTYQSLSDWIKALWLIVPPAFVLAALALVLRYRLRARGADAPERGEVICTIHADEAGVVRIYGHATAGVTDARPSLARTEAILSAPQPNKQLPPSRE